MEYSADVAFTAKDAIRVSQRGDVSIIIDVLRCCSTVVTALANGATGIIPAKTVMEARSLKKKHPKLILAGERKGLKPKGFDLGNSPIQFTPHAVGGKQLVLTTTSGTRAISFCKDAKWLLIGAILNAGAVAKAALRIAEKEERGIALVLSGTNWSFSLEDFVCAGLILDNLSLNGVAYSDSARASLLTLRQSRERLCEIIGSTQHAKYLRGIGLQKDVEFCCQMDIYLIVPFFCSGALVPLELE